MSGPTPPDTLERSTGASWTAHPNPCVNPSHTTCVAAPIRMATTERDHQRTLGDTLADGRASRPRTGSRATPTQSASTRRLTGRQYFCFNDTATTEIYTLSLHDALPI